MYVCLLACMYVCTYICIRNYTSYKQEAGTRESERAREREREKQQKHERCAACTCAHRNTCEEHVHTCAPASLSVRAGMCAAWCGSLLDKMMSSRRRHPLIRFYVRSGEEQKQQIASGQALSCQDFFHILPPKALGLGITGRCFFCLAVWCVQVVWGPGYRAEVRLSRSMWRVEAVGKQSVVKVLVIYSHSYRRRASLWQLIRRKFGVPFLSGFYRA